MRTAKRRGAERDRAVADLENARDTLDLSGRNKSALHAKPTEARATIDEISSEAIAYGNKWQELRTTIAQQAETIEWLEALVPHEPHVPHVYE